MKMKKRIYSKTIMNEIKSLFFGNSSNYWLFSSCGGLCGVPYWTFHYSGCYYSLDSCKSVQLHCS